MDKEAKSLFFTTEYTEGTEDVGRDIRLQKPQRRMAQQLFTPSAISAPLRETSAAQINSGGRYRGRMRARCSRPWAMILRRRRWRSMSSRRAASDWLPPVTFKTRAMRRRSASARRGSNRLRMWGVSRDRAASAGCADGVANFGGQMERHRSCDHRRTGTRARWHCGVRGRCPANRSAGARLRRRRENFLAVRRRRWRCRSTNYWASGKISSRLLRSGSMLSRTTLRRKVQVLAECSFADHCGEIAVRGGDDSQIDRNRLHAADGNDRSFLDAAEQFGLHEQRQLADFIEEQCAAIGTADETECRGQRRR